MQLDQGATEQKIQRISHHSIGKSQRVKALLIQKVRAGAVAIQIGSRHELKIRLLEFVVRFKSLLKHSAREKITNLQAHQRLSAPGGRRVHLCFEAVKRRIIKLKQSPALDIDGI